MEASDAENLRPFFTGLFKDHSHILELWNSPECRESLGKDQFRRLNTGNGRAVVTILDGPQTFERFRQIFQDSPDNGSRAAALGATIMDTKIGVFRAWATRQSTELPGLKDRGEYSKRRGFERLLADTFAWIWFEKSPQDYADKLNQRQKLAEKPAAVSQIPGGSYSQFIEFVSELLTTPTNKLSDLREKYGLTDDKIDIGVIMGLDAKKPEIKSGT